MSKLAELVAGGFVRAKAQVYINSNDGKGLAVFEQDMLKNGFSNLTDEHYEVNEATTDALRPYTGSVWFSHLTDEVRAEILPMMEERGSKEYVEKSGEVRVYNNPLFRLVVSLGVWNASVSVDAAPVVAEQRIQAVATRNFDAVSAMIEQTEQDISEHERLAQVNRRGGFKETGREHASKASGLKQKLQRLKAQQETLVASV